MIDDSNINNLAKNQVSAVFNSRAIRRSVSSKFIEICKDTPCWCPSGWAGNQQKYLSLSLLFCYKSVHLSLEEFKNIKMILFPIQEPVQMATFPEISHFLTNSAVMKMPRHAKAEIQA